MGTTMRLYVSGKVLCRPAYRLVLRVEESGLFSAEIDGVLAKGLIRDIATADDVDKVVNLGGSFLAAKVFLLEAVEVARAKGVRLAALEDLIRPMAELIVSLLASRRADLLARLMEALVPPEITKYYSYHEHESVFRDSVLSSVGFTVELKLTRRAVSLLEDFSELFNALATKLGEIPNAEVEYSIQKSESNYVMRLNLKDKNIAVFNFPRS